MNIISLVSSKAFVMDAYGFEGFAMVLMILVGGLGFMFIRRKKANNSKK